MHVLISGRAVELSDTDLIGVGGEARVYRHNGQAVKIFHDERVIDRKLKKIAGFPERLPREVITPDGLVFDMKKRPAGYRMRAVTGVEVGQLARRRYRQGTVENGTLLQLFSRIHRVICQLHARQVVVGDLNDGNVLVELSQQASPWFIDTDSMQIAGHPCIMGHERFLDPLLYGVDLTKRRAFSETSDWYAFSVMLFSCLLYVHPYGGIHAEYPTLLRRAEAMHSVLNDDVKYPKAAVTYRILPDALLAFFEQVFDHGLRDLFPERLLDLRWTRCACGLEHARSHCPSCSSAQRARDPRSGRCRVIRATKEEGRVLCAAMQNGLRYLMLSNRDGVLLREDGQVLPLRTLPAATRFGLSGRRTWIGDGDRLVAYENGRVVAETSTGRVQGCASFGAFHGGCYRLQDEWLLKEDNTRMGQILEGQTQVFIGEKFGFGFYRAGLATFYFLFHHNRPGLIDVDLPPIKGRLVDVAASFDEEHVLFSLAAERDGQQTMYLYLLAADGRLLGSAEGPPDSRSFLATVQGKCVKGGRVLAATEEGLLSLNITSDGLLQEGTLFSETEPFVAAGVELLAGSSGSVYVVSTEEITELTLNPKQQAKGAQ